MQTFSYYFTISVMANHATRQLDSPCIFSYLSCVQVLPYSIRGHAEQCTHAEVSVMSMF